MSESTAFYKQKLLIRRAVAKRNLLSKISRKPRTLLRPCSYRRKLEQALAPVLDANVGTGVRQSPVCVCRKYMSLLTTRPAPTSTQQTPVCREKGGATLTPIITQVGHHGWQEQAAARR